MENELTFESAEKQLQEIENNQNIILLLYNIF